MNKKRIHILHLDDDPIDAEIVSHHVEKDNYQVTWVDNEEAFKKTLQNESIDLVLSDYNMPDYSAMEALKEVRRHYQYMPFLVISGAIGDARAAEIIRNGADDYVLKDNLSRIQIAIENVLVKKNDKEKIHELESLYEILISTTNAGLIRWDKSSQCVFANERCGDIFEVSTNSVLNQQWLDDILENDKQHFLDLLADAIVQKKPGSIELRVLVGESRMVKWLNIHIQPELNAHHEMIGVTGTIFDITNIKEATYKASYDELTGLANRYLLNEIFDRALSKATPFAFIMFDIDHFKQINDKHGHPIGDALLREVAHRLTHHFRKEDLVGRIGGDEFAIILEDAKDIANLNVILTKLRSHLQAPYSIGELHLTTTLSIGVSIFTQDNMVNKEELIRQADSALYQAKESGRNKTCIYHKDMPLKNSK